jgi:hypothetical protein
VIWTGSCGCRAYRRGGLGHLVREPVPVPWIPPPALVPWQDPHLLRRALDGLRRL